jgi:hypothetical protein
MKEATFKESKRTKKKNKKMSKPGCSYSDDSDEDEEMDNFIRKLKKGTIKYKCMLPLICFNCGGIGHFSFKCPHKNKYSDEEEDYKREIREETKGNSSRKISTQRSTVPHQARKIIDSDSDSKRALFMEVEDDSEEEGEVDLRAEIIIALEEIRKERKKNKSLKEELKMKEGYPNSNSEEIEEMITSLKIQIEEEKIIEEVLRIQLEEKEKMIGSLEEKIVSLRKYFQKKDMQ